MNRFVMAIVFAVFGVSLACQKREDITVPPQPGRGKPRIFEVVRDYADACAYGDFATSSGFTFTAYNKYRYSISRGPYRIDYRQQESPGWQRCEATLIFYAGDLEVYSRKAVWTLTCHEEPRLNPHCDYEEWGAWHVDGPWKADMPVLVRELHEASSKVLAARLAAEKAAADRQSALEKARYQREVEWAVRAVENWHTKQSDSQSTFGLETGIRGGE